MLRIWDINLEDKEPLSIVIPVLVYHGKQKWHKKTMSTHFGNVPELLKGFIPEFEYLLADLSKYSDEEIRTGLFTRVPLIIATSILKHIFNNKQFETIFKGLVNEESAFLSKSSGLRFLKMVSLYILQSTKIPVDNYISLLQEVSDEAGEVGMTTAELLKKEGKIEGKTEGKIEAVEKMLENGFDWDTIVKITGISRLKFNQFKKTQK